MNARAWIHGLWPALFGVSLLLPGNGVGDRQLDTAPPARKAIEAPLPRSQQSNSEGGYEVSADQGAVFVSGGSGHDAFRAKTDVFESRLVVVHGEPTRLVVAFTFATLSPAPNDLGPANTFEQRLAATLGASSDARLRLELECAGRETLPGGIASRIRWRGKATSGHLSQSLDFCLWQCSRVRDGMQTLGTFQWPETDANPTQPPVLGRHAEANCVTVGLDLGYPGPD